MPSFEFSQIETEQNREESIGGPNPGGIQIQSTPEEVTYWMRETKNKAETLRSRKVAVSCGTNGSNLGEMYFLKLVKKQAMEIWLLQKQNTTIKLKDMSSPSFLILPLGKKYLLKILQHQKKRVLLTNTSRKPPKLKSNRQNRLLLLMEENVKPLK